MQYSTQNNTEAAIQYTLPSYVQGQRDIYEKRKLCDLEAEMIIDLVPSAKCQVPSAIVLQVDICLVFDRKGK
jgi:hypothetical protein